MHKVSNDHVIKADGRLWEAPRGSAASWVEVARHVLDGRRWVPHQGRMIDLAEVDPQANATAPRGSGSAPQPPRRRGRRRTVCTAAGIAYANDLRPLVDPEGGYRDPHDDPDNQRIRPALLLLDPLVRLHSLDEYSASDISSLLGFLRAINRRHQLALVLVHHMAKRSRRSLGQSLRGSSDLHAWTDSACYLVRRSDDRLQLTVEHRSAPAPDPLLLRLSGGGDQPLSLLVDSADAPPPPLPEAVRAALRSAGQPLSRTVLRQRLRVNNARLGVALQSLQQRGLAVRSPNGLAPAVMIRTVRCLLALIRPPFRCSTVPHQARARNGTTTATLRVIYPATNLDPGRATQHDYRCLPPGHRPKLR